MINKVEKKAREGAAITRDPSQLQSAHACMRVHTHPHPHPPHGHPAAVEANESSPKPRATGVTCLTMFLGSLNGFG